MELKRESCWYKLIQGDFGDANNKIRAFLFYLMLVILIESNIRQEDFTIHHQSQFVGYVLLAGLIFIVVINVKGFIKGRNAKKNSQTSET